MKTVRPGWCPILFVSIPFKRESVSKVVDSDVIRITVLVSIPFKRESVSKGTTRLARGAHQRNVSIPFKRESVSKGTGKNLKLPPKVSIPFKRESVSKAIAQEQGDYEITSFNSLQTGKRIQSGRFVKSLVNQSDSFQFPSNGKAYPKYVGLLQRKEGREESFNSLQTGKRIQSGLYGRGRSASTGFNSLQTGKRIQRCIICNEDAPVA